MWRALAAPQGSSGSSPLPSFVVLAYWSLVVFGQASKSSECVFSSLGYTSFRVQSVRGGLRDPEEQVCLVFGRCPEVLGRPVEA